MTPPHAAHRPPALHTVAWRALLAGLLAAGCWFAFASEPGTAGVELWDKAQHALAFAAMAVSARFGWPEGRRPLPAIAAGLLGYGLFIEAVQSFIPSRSAEWGDVLADAVGIAAGLALAAAWLRLRKPA